MSNLYYVQPVGPHLVMLTPVAGHPDQGLPGGERPVDPGFGWGGGERPGHLPAYPGMPVDPGFGWGGGGRPSHPIAGGGGLPDNTLPSTPPPQVLPGWTLVMVRSADMKWHYATIAPSSPPPRPTPEPIPPGGAPDQGLPPQPAHPIAPGGGSPPTAGQLPGAPPTAQPKPA
jgi:hypothetical protein